MFRNHSLSAGLSNAVLLLMCSVPSVAQVSLQRKGGSAEVEAARTQDETVLQESGHDE